MGSLGFTFPKSLLSFPKPGYSSAYLTSLSTLWPRRVPGRELAHRKLLSPEDGSSSKQGLRPSQSLGLVHQLPEIQGIQKPQGVYHLPHVGRLHDAIVACQRECSWAKVKLKLDHSLYPGQPWEEGAQSLPQVHAQNTTEKGVAVVCRNLQVFGHVHWAQGLKVCPPQGRT